jgi:heme A synthase
MALVVYFVLIGWGLAALINDSAIAIISSFIALLFSVVLVYLRMFREWTPESAAAFRKRLGRLLVPIAIGLGILTLLLIVYLMARNNA